MSKRDAYDQLLNVMEGYTADGKPRGAPVAVAGGNRSVAEIGLMVAVLFRDLSRHIPGDMQQDRVRTAIILVFVRWLKLTGVTTHLRLRLMRRRVVTPPAH